MAESGETSSQDLEAQPLPQSAHWMDPLIEKIGELKVIQLKTSIFKVPSKLRKVDEEAYSPRIVSIGPFHKSTTTISVLPQTLEHKEDHQKTPAKKLDHLLAMEKQKRLYIVQLLKRMEKFPNPKQSSQDFFVEIGEAILELDETVRGRYAEDIILDRHQLAEIMLVDGCFILELFLRSRLRDFKEQEDPIFHNAWMVPALRRDLALLENQIPFFILETLFDKIIKPLIPEIEHQLITDLALYFFNMQLNENSIPKKDSQDGEHLHLLDLLHKFYACHKIDPDGEKYIHWLPEKLHLLTRISNDTAQCTEKLLPQRMESWGFKKSASKLLEAGIELEKGQENGHLLEISFDEAKGDIIIPPMRIDETTKSLLRNFIAYEQCRGSAQQHITSYAILLGTLIHSKTDVELLQKKQIVTTDDLSEVENVLTFFKNISREVVPKEFYFGDLCKDVDKYQERCHWHRFTAFLMLRCRRYMVELKSKYFSSPWTFMSFIAAIALLILTIVQTMYAVLSYKHSH